MPKILVYVRPWNKSQFEHIARNVWPESELLFVSEHKSIDESGLPTEFDHNLNKNTIEIDALTEIEIIDVIRRCRLLRAVNEDDARKMVSAMYAAIIKLLKFHRPITALFIAVDSYVIHLIKIACERSGIPFIGIMPSFVNGYFRVTALGERNESRNTEKNELIEVTAKLVQKNYKPNFLAQTASDVHQRAKRNWLRNLPKPIWFGALRWIKGDRWNYHYCASQVVSMQHWSFWPQSYIGVKPTNREALEDKESNKPLVFLPLQMSPEATVDYWSFDTSWIDYEAKVLSIIDAYSRSHRFIAKEHPNVLGFRSRGFYEQLSKRSNCVLVSTEISSNALLDFCDAVVICTGTVGFEAALRGIPVFSDSQPYHLPRSSVKPINELANLTSLNKSTNPPKINDIMEYLMNGLLKGNLINDGSWNPNNTRHIKENLIIADSLRNFINN